MTESNSTTETEESGESAEREAPLAELAYTTACRILDDGDEALRLDDLLIEPSSDGGEPWTVLRSLRVGGDEMLTEADIFYPERFSTAQELAKYLAGVAVAGEEDWPVYVTTALNSDDG